MNKTTKAENQHPYNLEVLSQRIEDLESIIQGYQNVIASMLKMKNINSFFNTIEHILFVLDMQGNILQVNDTVTHKLGYSQDELSGQSVLIVHPPEQREEAGKIVAEMLAGRAEYCPVPVMTRDGVQIPVETRVTLGKWSGQDVIFGITKDISDIKASGKILKSFSRKPGLHGP
ncbi:MAG: PAS domain S-box protein [Anaerolineales bacterium]|uniref:PAS domain S-box protein n=1 Tax=Candidatus Villigracilis proximus TaxID=3140683 RepID=UPI0031374B8C|nr:PAS domain S-box protein [Anaerolineales bacterium]